MTRYPVLLLHGAGFRDLRRPLYWGRIPACLAARGARVFHGGQDAWGGAEANAAALLPRVLEVLAHTGAPRLHLIGHSKGGLEARLLAADPALRGRIASVTTIATPHRGSATVDRLLRAPRGLHSAAAFAVDNWVRVIGDRQPDFLAVARGLSTAAMADFNARCPDRPEVFYQSYACVMRAPASDLHLALANRVVSRIEGENDGMVALGSALWGARRIVLRGAGRRGVSHLDAIDFRRSGPAIEGFGDICEVYADMLAALRERGL